MSENDTIAFIKRVIATCQSPDNHECVKQWLESLVLKEKISSEAFQELMKVNQEADAAGQ